MNPPPFSSRLTLFGLAESIKGPWSPPVLDNAYPVDPSDDKVEGLFRLLEFLLNNGVKMGKMSMKMGKVSINDIRHGKREKILPFLKALKIWEEQLRTHGERFVVPIGM